MQPNALLIRKQKHKSYIWTTSFFFSSSGSCGIIIYSPKDFLLPLEVPEGMYVILNIKLDVSGILPQNKLH